MQVTSITNVMSAPKPFVVIDHDGASFEAPCMSRYCPPGHHGPVVPKPVDPKGPQGPILVDHDGKPFPPPHGGGHGRA